MPFLGRQAIQEKPRGANKSKPRQHGNTHGFLPSKDETTGYSPGKRTNSNGKKNTNHFEDVLPINKKNYGDFAKNRHEIVTYGGPIIFTKKNELQAHSYSFRMGLEPDKILFHSREGSGFLGTVIYRELKS